MNAASACKKIRAGKHEISVSSVRDEFKISGREIQDERGFGAASMRDKREVGVR